MQYIIQHNHIPHAQLFWGAAGSAQLSLALGFATYLNCEDKQQEDACNNCYSCFKMHKLIHPDVKFVFPVGPTKKITGKEVVSNSYLKEWRSFIQEQPYGLLSDWSYHVGSQQKQLAIPKEEARQIIQHASIKPLVGKYKIILIWLPEYLHPTAANALLKVLEEPAQQTIFLLVSIEPQKILNTICSRTQAVYVPAFKDEAITKILQARYPLAQEKIAQVVAMADGNLNQALKLISNKQEKTLDQFITWMRLCYTQHLPKLIAQAELFQQLDKEGQKYLLNYALYMFRETLVIVFNQPRLCRSTDLEQAFITKLRQHLTTQEIKIFSGWLNQAYYYLERNVNTKILWLNLSLKIAHIFQNATKARVPVETS